MEDNIQIIIDNGNIEDMYELSNILTEAVEHLEKCNPKKFRELKIKIHKMAFGDHLDRETAEEIVANMRPYGKKWTYEQIVDLQNEKGLNNICSPDFFTVMNQGYNDYINLFEEDIDNYITYTLDFIEDEDAKPGKVVDYFL